MSTFPVADRYCLLLVLDLFGGQAASWPLVFGRRCVPALGGGSESGKASCLSHRWQLNPIMYLWCCSCRRGLSLLSQWSDRLLCTSVRSSSGWRRPLCWDWWESSEWYTPLPCTGRILDPRDLPALPEEKMAYASALSPNQYLFAQFLWEQSKEDFQTSWGRRGFASSPPPGVLVMRGFVALLASVS